MYSTRIPSAPIRTLISALTATLALVISPEAADGARVKDVASLAGVRDNALTGYGLVVGLNGTGDSQQALFTVQSVAAMLSRMGIRVDPKRVRTRNVAAVMVTATLPPFAGPGTRIDITASSLGNAKSLRGGTLLLTPLRAVDGHVYAMAQGPLAVGGFSAGRAGSRVTKNHPTVGTVPGGGTVERSVPVRLDGRSQLVYQLHKADFTTASNVARAISAAGATARALDSRRVVVQVPPGMRKNVVDLVARIERARVEIDVSGKVIVNARTGTVVLGANVTLGKAALAYGGLQVEIDATNDVSQPGGLSRGRTARVSNARVTAREGAGQVHLMRATARLEDLVKALNALGVKPRDLIDILQALRAAGALNAEIVVQ